MSDYEKRKFGEDFMKKLHEQVQAGIPPMTKEQLDRKIMNTVNKWREKETPGYENLRDTPKTDIEAFAHYHAKAGVPRETGWEYTKEKLKGYYDYEEDMKEEYDAEYSRTEFSQTFRDKFEKH